MLKKDLPFKLIIPSDVQRKIDLMCLKINNIEWSGSLFYEVEGSWKENNLVIKLLDFFLQDIGDSGSTTFEQTPDMVGYRLDHDLLTAHMGLIHSHHNMQAFFSGTDINTLKSEALDHNHFLSLVVNNRRQYVAAITAVYTYKRTKQVKEDKSYTTFNGVVENILGNEFEETEEIQEVEYTPLEIVIEDYEESNTELLARIDEVRKLKAAAPKFPPSPQFNTYGGGGNSSFPFNQHAGNSGNSTFQSAQPTLFDQREGDDWFDSRAHKDFKTFLEQKDAEEKAKTKAKEQEQEQDITDIHDIPVVVEIPSDVTEYKAKQLVTLSRVIPKDNKISIGAFIKSMPTLYKDCFTDMGHFMSFISFFVEDIIVDGSIINDPKNEGVAEEFLTYYVALEIISLLEEEAKGETNPYYEALLDEIKAYLYL